jgi:hypothetical protein
MPAVNSDLEHFISAISTRAAAAGTRYVDGGDLLGTTVTSTGGQL